jgi:hypothetical protein
VIKELRVLSFADIFNESVGYLSYPEDDRASFENVNIDKYLRGQSGIPDLSEFEIFLGGAK